jgi:hypothetical protein
MFCVHLEIVAGSIAITSLYVWLKHDVESCYEPTIVILLNYSQE